MSRAYWIGILFLFVAAGCSHQAPEEIPDKPFAASISLSTNIVRIGDEVTAVMTLYHPTNGTVSLPDINQGRKLVVRSEERQTEPTSAGRHKTTVTYTLTSFEIGNHVMSTGTVECLIDGKPRHTQPYPIALLTVNSLLDATNTPPRDIKDPLTWSKTPFPRWLIGIILVVVLSIIAGIVALILTKKKGPLIKPPPVIPAHEIAIKALRDLDSKGWIEEKNVEPFFVELSNIVRLYLERRFQLHAPEQTTEEFIRSTADAQVLSEEHR
ncbi:MAG: hypothetical protein AAF492_17255, partial [Verrucomicrobiota bacterium]